MQNKTHFTRAKEKILTTVLSLKFHILIVTTYLFYVGKLTQDNWKEVVFVISGYRVINEVSSLFANKKQPQEPSDK